MLTGEQKAFVKRHLGVPDLRPLEPVEIIGCGVDVCCVRFLDGVEQWVGSSGVHNYELYPERVIPSPFKDKWYTRRNP